MKIRPKNFAFYINDNLEILNLIKENRLRSYENNKVTLQNDISDFLNNPTSKENIFKYLKNYFKFEFDENDLLDYIQNVLKREDTKLVDIPLKELLMHKVGGFNDTLTVYLYDLIIKCSCNSSFELENRTYSFNEVKDIIIDGKLYPICKKVVEKRDMPEEISLYKAQNDDLNYLGSLNKFNENCSYYDYFISKIMNVIDFNILMQLIRSDLVYLYSDKLEQYYLDKYHSDENEKQFYTEKIQSLINKFNGYAKTYGINLIFLDESETFLTSFLNDYVWDDYAIIEFLSENTLTKMQAEVLENYIIEYEYSDLFDILRDYYSNFNEQFNVERLVNALVSQYTDDEYNSLDYLKYYKKYLDENSLNKLLQVIYNSGNEETINEVIKLGYTQSNAISRSRKKNN